MTARGSFLTGFIIRVLASMIVVLLTYNPSGFSYMHWVTGEGAFDSNLPLKIVAGILLIICYAVLIRSTLYSIRIYGALLVAALVAAIVWSMVYYGVLDLSSGGIVQWVVLLGVGFVLGIGLSWSIIRRWLSGQYTVDEAENVDEV